MLPSLPKLAFLLGLASVARCQNSTTNVTQPYSFGMVVYPGFTSLDVFGPLDALNTLSFTEKINLTIMAETLDPVWTNRMAWFNSSVGATFGEAILPTHTFSTPPSDMDVLIVPGGIGTRAPGDYLDTTVAFVRSQFPKVKYLITVCTGAGIAARAGVLDGVCATTNKKAWATVMPWGPHVKWVAEARWVQDGDIWSSSGVSAGIDVMIAFIAAKFGEAKAVRVVNDMEYHRQTNSTDDSFAALYGLTNAKNSTNQEVDKC